jgi:small subunit ribosomal protein S2
MAKLPTLQQLLEAGVHFGHQIRRGHPKMRPYIYGAREGVHIIDLTQSEKGLKEACAFAEELGKSGKVLLFVGTKRQAQSIVEELAKKIGAPYLVNRWIGGFLTNFDEVAKNIKKLKELTEQKEKGGLKKYTKKEQLIIDRRVAQLERDLGGAKQLEKFPDALFVIDAVRDVTALKEARIISSTANNKVSVIAIADSNSDPSLIDYPIPGNDDAIKSIKILTTAIADAYEDGLKQAKDIKDKKDIADAKAAEDIANAKISEEVAVEVAAAEEEIEKKVLADSERKS